MKISPILFAIIVTIFLANSFFMAKIIKKLNGIRIIRAKELYEESRINTNDSLYLLVQSDILDPSDEKKIKIAENYLKLGNSKLGIWYFGRVRNKNGFMRYAETALENNNDYLYEGFRNNLDNQTRLELETFKRFKGGDYKSLEKITENQQTNLGKALKLFNTRNYRNVEGDGDIINVIRKNQNLSRQQAELEIANSLLTKQPKISYFLLNRIINESPEIADAYIIMADYYKIYGESEKAIDCIKKASENDPSNPIIYQKGVEISKMFKNQTSQSYFEIRLKALKTVIQ